MTTEDATAPGLAAGNPLEPLILDFLHWLEPHPRPYGEALEAWRTSCPRLTVWEDAHDRGLVHRIQHGGGPALALTDLGRQALRT